MNDPRDNERIMKIIASTPGVQERTIQRLEKRLQIGYTRYGQGVDASADTRKWGTAENSWLEMLAEEVEDAFIYAGAHYVRTGDEKKVDEIFGYLQKIHALLV